MHIDIDLENLGSSMTVKSPHIGHTAEPSCNRCLVDAIASQGLGPQACIPNRKIALVWKEWNKRQADLDSMGLVGQLPRTAKCLVIFTGKRSRKIDRFETRQMVPLIAFKESSSFWAFWRDY